jgi:hypothetical protein
MRKVLPRTPRPYEEGAPEDAPFFGALSPTQSTMSTTLAHESWMSEYLPGEEECSPAAVCERSIS